MKIAVLERNTFGADLDISPLLSLGETMVYEKTAPEDIAAQVQNADIIVANKSPLNESTLEQAERVKLICEFATGYNNVDLDYCDRKGITVCNAVGYSTPVVAQHTIAMALYLIEKLPVYDRFVKDGAYEKSGVFTCFEPYFTELAGKTWGIVGLGHIGEKVAQIAEVFGCRIIYYSTSGSHDHPKYERVDFDTLLAESDVISLHCPLNDRTEGLMNEGAFRKMKKTAVLINVARGPVVQEQALAEALKSGEIAAAGLDVLEKEPIVPENPLKEISDSTKLLITPHMAWGSLEARTRCLNEVCANIQAFLDGDRRNVVNHP